MLAQFTDIRRSLQALRANRQGFVLPTAAVFFIVSLPIVGLVVDVGLDYMIQTKLQMAIDAAVLAGARSLSRGDDSPTQTTNAEAIANQYLTANFPSGYLGVTTPQVTNIDVQQSADAVRTVTMTATATMPPMFMGWFGTGSTKVGATAQASRRDVNVMIVMDRSGSLANSGSCSYAKAGVSGFAQKFANGTDIVGLITFASSSNLDFPPSAQFNSSTAGNNTIPYIANEIDCSGATSTAQALWQAYQALTTLSQTGALNVIVLFTDGDPTAVTTQMPRAASSSCAAAVSGIITGVYTVGFNSAGVGTTTGGIFQSTNSGQPMSSDSTLVSPTTNCNYATNWTTADKDIVGLSTTDVWGNNLTSGWQSVTTTTSGGKTYVKVGESSTYATNVTNASMNAADDAANRILTGSSPGNGKSALSSVYIYTIGLGTSENLSNSTLLERIANQGGVRCSSCAQGEFYYAPGAADISDAFAKVADQILHLSK